MFERSRIGGEIYKLGDSLSAAGSPVNNRRVKVLYHSFLDQAARDMKINKLKLDQATIAFIIEIGNTYVRKGVIEELYDRDREACVSLINLYLGAYLKMCSNSSYFKRAEELFDQSVFDKIQNPFGESANNARV